ncbi:2Fe-2S iron-sulfur cluster-binding protein [Rhodococcus sp. LB1]|uniref:2Fe-2S iron-sulfur cluster-binding protein n=1 Tax=Rhodococcus sp. LB1 TaxID=1807499 RepID=UPI00077B0A12|nr:2Fe-2S iron-sulfur cluster-binding protein [Rhodococcus sp. LB1]KXX60424.1 ferredoxin [Rhodococcus sp. LB1]
MVQITFIAADEAQYVADARPGQTVMQVAIAADIDGIVGECGGNAMCATCHVYVEEGGAALSALEPEEDEMLQCAASPRQINSRLSCQIVLDDAVDGLVVRLPKEQ